MFDSEYLLESLLVVGLIAIFIGLAFIPTKKKPKKP
jgi:hypothetical protein